MTRLADLTWQQVQERDASHASLLVPVGSTEQHGPHLPLSTDTDIASAIAERAAARLPGSFVAPALAYGSCGEHQDFTGTLSVGQSAVELLLIELVRSAYRSFRRVAFVSTHGGNLDAVHRSCALLSDEGRPVLVWVPPWRGDAHAGHIETAVMMAIEPERVLADRLAEGNTTQIEQLMPELRHHGVRHASPSGVLGDPRGASACEGEQLLERAVRDLIEHVERLEESCTASRL